MAQIPHKLGKKAQIDFVNKLMKLFVLVLFGIIPWTILLLMTGAQEIDDKETLTSLVNYKLMTQHCFSDELGIVDEKNVNQERFTSCLEGLDKEKVSLKIYLPNSHSFIYGSSEEEYNKKTSSCFVSSVELCTQLSYPVLFRKESGEESIETVLLETIIS